MLDLSLQEKPQFSLCGLAGLFLAQLLLLLLLLLRNRVALKVNLLVARLAISEDSRISTSLCRDPAGKGMLCHGVWTW